ncbi:MAG: hypothetical protein JZU65_12785 [Chlorobium sp.]|nr:hypothetical protein [Chlorobium sp.]
MIEAFKLKDIQNFLALLNMFEAQGITDIRFVRERIQNGVSDQLLQHRKTRKTSEDRSLVKPSPMPMRICPSCLQDTMIPAANVDGLKILACRKCRYSEVVE